MGTAERRAAAIRLRLAGGRWADIAQQLGYADRGEAHKDVTRALAQHAGPGRD